MKEQVKTRMEVLLDQETEARRSSQTAPREAAPQGVQRGSLLGGAPGRRKDSSRVRVKADLLFHTDTGKLAAMTTLKAGVCVGTFTKSIMVA